MKETLSQKLFTQSDGKRFAYADEIKKTIKELKHINFASFIDQDKDGIFMDRIKLDKEIEEIFGKELN